MKPSQSNLVVCALLLFGILMAGCTMQGQVPANQTVQPQAPTPTYACPDGTIVTNISDCPAQAPAQNATVTKYVCPDNSTVDNPSECPPARAANVSSDTCSDGTKQLACATDKPMFCDINLNLVEKASRCGCPVNSDPYEDTCLLRCPDGTLSGECSTTKPQQCYNGTLTDNPGLCGCPTGYVVSGSTCAVYVLTPEDVYLNSSVLQNRYVKLVNANLDFTVVRAGYYEDVEPAATERYMRLDLDVTNRGSQPTYLFDSDMKIVDDNNNQYSADGGTFQSGVIEPDAEVRGSVLFDLGTAQMPPEVTLYINDNGNNVTAVQMMLVTLNNTD
jgi:hypothetical protein